ncbi:BlaI/MecI/CopY family transcriptional regulator [Gracilibacillus alcaliphilus]|uniref:BlaI/MecI/CopY family transcriptional regulator n=1 Tax=Gracilibacillus alcaliphilus TaxID=1401441 RepID=UPI00195B84E9|nr:BlaI/MecI/CopY family transcriptional regulator [Gracilibacillus alcaliphilus]MBM7678283.1 putative transcriptional regulator [Gracilibacillus alcaliphilus]
MSDFRSLSETEMKVMKVIWKMGRPVKSNELLEIFSEKEGKEWKGQTIATFLSRLVDKGVLLIEREGRPNTYVPRLSFKEYKKREAQNFLETMYQGSIKSFLATLYDDKISPEELEELQKWFSDK